MKWSLFKKHEGIQISNKYYLLIQDKWAKKMSRLTLGLSRKRLVSLLIGFVVLSSSTSIYIIYRGLNFSISSIDSVSISKPAEVNKQLKNNVLKSFPISKKEYEKIIRFRYYLDSLERSFSGKKTYDSIKLVRPGLMDSLAFIENYYKSNVKD
jgi:hypothetical protein